MKIKIKIILNGIKNGLTFILASAIIALWYYFSTQKYPASASAYLLLALSTAGIINLLDLGISLKVIHRLSTPFNKDHWSSKTVVASSIIGSLLVQATAGSVLYYLIQQNSPLPDGFRTYILVLVFALSTQGVQTVIAILKGFFDFNRANIALLTSTLLVYGTTILPIIKGLDPELILATMSAGQCVAAVIAASLIPRQKIKSEDNQRILTWIRYLPLCYYQMLCGSLKFFPQIFAGTFFLHIQRFFIIEILGSKALANFSFAYALASRLHSVVNSFFDLLFPYAARIIEGRSAIKVAVLTGTAATAICFIGAGILGIGIHHFAPAVLQPFFLYVLGVLFAMASAPAFHLMNGLNKGHSVSLYSLLAPVVFALVLLLHKLINVQQLEGIDQILIPTAYSISMFVVLLLTWHAMRRIKT